MSLVNAKRLFDDARIQLDGFRFEDAKPIRLVVYDLANGLSALSEGLEKECRQIKEMLADIHLALGDATDPEVE